MLNPVKLALAYQQLRGKRHPSEHIALRTNVPPSIQE